MADISNLLKQLLQAVYGKDVRQALVDAIKQCYEDVSVELPTIGENGNWFIGDTDTGKSSIGYIPIRGVDYWTEADEEEIVNFLIAECAKRGQLKPEFANTIEECVDTTKIYLLPDGFLYAYMFKEVVVGGFVNYADKSSNDWIEGARISSSGTVNQDTALFDVTNYKEALQNIVSAYNNRENYNSETIDVSTGRVSGSKGTWGDGVASEYKSSITVTKDFTNAKGEIVAYLHGHTHIDAINTSLLGCPMISITTAGTDVRDVNEPTRAVGTATETALDIVTIDKSARKIYMTRLGAGQGTADREVSY